MNDRRRIAARAKEIEGVPRARGLLRLAPMRPLLSLFVLAASTAACAASTPRARVAEDLGCTTRHTSVRKLAVDAPKRGMARWEVAGCGRRAIYVCTTPVRDCWREGQVQQRENADDPGPAAP